MEDLAGVLAAHSTQVVSCGPPPTRNSRPSMRYLEGCGGESCLAAGRRTVPLSADPYWPLMTASSCRRGVGTVIALMGCPLKVVGRGSPVGDRLVSKSRLIGLSARLRGRTPAGWRASVKRILSETEERTSKSEEQEEGTCRHVGILYAVRVAVRTSYRDGRPPASVERAISLSRRR